MLRAFFCSLALMISGVAGAQLNLSTSTWKGFGGIALGCDGEVYDVLKLADNRVLAIGEFRACGSTLLNHIGIWNGSTWQGIEGLAGTIGTNGVVNQAWINSVGEVYFTGEFSSAGGVPITNRFARFNGTTFASMGVDPDTWPTLSSETSIRITSTHYRGSKLYTFGNFGGYVYDGLIWRYMDIFGPSGTDSGVLSVAENTEEFFISQGGSGYHRGIDDTWRAVEYGCPIQSVFGYENRFLASLSDMPTITVALRDVAGSQGVCESFEVPPVSYPGLNSALTTSVIFDDQYQWAFGNPGFCSASNSAIACRRLTTSTIWQEVLLNASESELQSIRQIVRLNPNQWIFSASGSRFSGVEYEQLFQVESTGAIRPLGDPRAKGILGHVNVVALSHDRSLLYVGGRFSLAGSIRANNVAQWDGENWSSLNTSSGNGVDGEVFALHAAADGSVLVGGIFANAAAVPVNNIAVFSRPSMGSLGEWRALGAGLPAPVRAVTDSLNFPTCAALDTTEFGPAATVSSVQCFNGTSWFNPAVGFIRNRALTLTSFGGVLYVGGENLQLNNVDSGLITRVVPDDPLQPAYWASLGTANAAVKALGPSGNSLMLVGEFTNAIDVSVPFAIARSGFNWGNPFGMSQLDLPADAISIGNGANCVGGRFLKLGASSVNHVVCRQTSGEWIGLGQLPNVGTNAPIRAIATSQNQPNGLANKIFVAGDFDLAGGQLSLGIAEFSAVAEAVFANGFE